MTPPGVATEPGEAAQPPSAGYAGPAAQPGPRARPEPAQSRWRRIRSLRARLVAGLLLVSTLGLLVVDIAALFTFRAYLLDRLDDQLVAAAPTVAARLLQGSDLLPPSSGDPGQVAPTDFVIQIVDDSGRITALIADPEIIDPRELPVITGMNAAEVASRGGAPFSVQGGDGADYRAVAVRLGPNLGAVVVSIPLSELSSTTDRLLVIEAVATAAAVVLMTLLALLVVRLGLRPLTGVGITATAIADGDLTRRVSPAEPGTEVGRLGLALNDMLTQIEAGFSAQRASEERLRQFLADASHELRTPVTSIRGYAELHRQGAVTDPAHLRHVMARIEAEAVRMGRLVEDLLTLTRLDQAPTSRHESVDLVQVAADAVHDLQAVQPGRTIHVDLAASPVVVLGDQHELTQVLSNLTGNLRVHVPVESAVRVSVVAEDGWGVVRVADEGPGMTAEVAARVFERFYRADAGRSRDRGGAGLGLAIVAAIVSAHGGTVGVTSQPAAGTTFTVRLPLRRG